MDGIRTEGEFWRRSLTYLSDLIAQLSGGVSITNDITDPIPVQQGDLNADVDEVTAFAGNSNKLIDEVSSTLIYIGEAAPQSATSSAVWRIKKIDFNNPTSIKYAGAGLYDQVWDDRASLTY